MQEQLIISGTPNKQKWSLPLVLRSPDQAVPDIFCGNTSSRRCSKMIQQIFCHRHSYQNVYNINSLSLKYFCLYNGFFLKFQKSYIKPMIITMFFFCVVFILFYKKTKDTIVSYVSILCSCKSSCQKFKKKF